MKAIHLNNYGSTDNFAVVDLPIPEPAQGQIVIKTEYAGLRWGDIMQRNGLPTRARPTPFVPGQEAAGKVVALGPDVQGLAIGDRVVANLFDGAYAEYVVASAGAATVVPDHVGLDAALAYPTNMRTAHLIVFAWAKVREGETVLLHAASGGVGLLVLQILKRCFSNVRVIGICSSADKAALLTANGCDHVINRTTQDYVVEVSRICGSKSAGVTAGSLASGGVDVALNGVSGPTLTTDPQVIRKRGRWVIYGYSAGPATIDFLPFVYDSITIMPFSSIAFFGTPEGIAADKFAQQWMATEELITPEIWPLDKVAEAQQAMEAGHTTGKVVFKIG